MSDNFTQFYAAGLDYLAICRLDTNNYPTGWTADPANGAVAGNGGMRRIEIAVNIPQLTTEPPATNIEGDNIVRGKFLWPADVPEFVVTARGFDMDTTAGLQTTNVVDIGDMAFDILNPSDPDYITVMLIATSNSKELTSGSEGQVGYVSYILLAGQAVPLGPDSIQYRQEHTDQYKVTADTATHFLGETIADNFGTTGGPILRVTSQYRLDIISWRGNAAAVTFNLTPGRDLQEASGDKCRVWVNGVRQTYAVDYTANIAANTITFAGGSTPAAGAVICCLYQWS